MRKGKSPRPLVRRGFRIELGANERAISVRQWKEESSFFYSSLFFSLWKWFERTNSSRDVERRLHLSQARNARSLVEMLGKDGGIFSKRAWKRVPSWRARGRNIYGGILEKYFFLDGGEGGTSVLFISGWNARRGRGSRFRRKIERGFGKQRDKYLRALNRSLLFAAVKLGRGMGGKMGRRFSFDRAFLSSAANSN